MPQPSYPATGMCFELIADGKQLGEFSECSGLTVEVNSEDYREGGQNGFVYKLPTQISHPTLVLKGGVSADVSLQKWVLNFAANGALAAKKQVTINLNTPQGKTVRSWVAARAYPLKWEGPNLNAMEPNVAFESIELAHQGLQAGSAG